MNKLINLKFIISLAGIFFLLASCEEKAFNFVLNIDEEYQFDAIDNNGVFSVATEISRDDILDDIEIESDSEIESVDVESFAVKITEVTGNEATSVNLEGLMYLEGDISQTPFTVFDNLIVNGDNASDFIAVTSLNAAAINALSVKLLAYVNNTDNDNFIFQLNGTSIPDGSRVAATVELKMRATVKFKENLEVPFFVGDE